MNEILINLTHLGNWSAVEVATTGCPLSTTQFILICILCALVGMGFAFLLILINKWLRKRKNEAIK